jgi:hypothetical protein
MPWFTDLVKCPEYSANVRQVTSIREYTYTPCEPVMCAGKTEQRTLSNFELVNIHSFKHVSKKSTWSLKS